MVCCSDDDCEFYDEYYEDDWEDEEEMTEHYPDSYYGLKLVNHGGMCCGIKTIYGFSCNPNSTVSDLSACKYRNRSAANGQEVHCNERFFTDEAPAETYLQRLDRYIKFVETHSPKHLIEVTLTSYQYESWKDVLRKRRFRKVSQFVNSNSGNTVIVLHKYVGQPRKSRIESILDPFSG